MAFPIVRRENLEGRTFMRMGIPDKKAREVTITLYLNKPAFRKALDMQDEDRIYVLLVNRKGEVLWRVDGPFNDTNQRDWQGYYTGTYFIQSTASSFRA